MGLPANMRTQKNACAVLLLVQSQKLTRKRLLLPKYQAAMQAHLGTIMQTFFFVFNENSRVLRVGFFSDPLVQLLWSRFLKQETDMVRSSLQQVLGNSQSALRTFNFKSDVAFLQQACNFEILPAYLFKQ